MLPSDKFYTSLCAVFAAIIIVNNIIYQKFIAITIIPFYPLELSVGAILYPFTFFITDIMAECYGLERARFCIRLGILLGVAALLVIASFSYIPSTTWSKMSTDTYKEIFGLCWVALIGSIIASFISQSVDAKLYIFLRKITNYKYLWVVNISSAIAIFIDTSIVVSFVTLFGLVPDEKMLSLTLDSYIFKILMTLCSTPLFYLLVGRLRKVNYSSK